MKFSRYKLLSLAIILVFVLSAVGTGNTLAQSTTDTNSVEIENEQLKQSSSTVEDDNSRTDDKSVSDAISGQDDQISTEANPSQYIQANLASMEAIDVNDNGLAEYLSITITIDFNESSLYDWSIYIYDGSSSQIYTNSKTRYYGNYSTDININIPAFELEDATSGNVTVDLSLTDNTNNQQIFNYKEIGKQYVDMNSFEITDFVVYTDQITDEFMDRDGNGRYEEIIIKVKVYVNISTFYDINSYLYRSSTSEASISQNDKFLSNGTHTLTYKFSTDDLVTNPSTDDITFRMDVSSAMGAVNYISDYTVLHTLSMSPDPSQFGSNFISYLSATMTSKDINNNGKIDYLLVNTTFKVNRSDNYFVQAYLKNENSTSYSAIATDTTEQNGDNIFFPAGEHTVSFVFSASDITSSNTAHIYHNGPYYVTFEYDNGQIGRYNDTTAYSISDYDTGTISPTGTYNERIVDIDSDSTNEYYVIDVEVNVMEAGLYRFNGEIQNDSFSYYGINSDTVTQFLDVGIHTVSLPFYGLYVNNTGETGFYDFNQLTISKANDRLSNYGFITQFNHDSSDGVLYQTSILDAFTFTQTEQSHAGSATFNGTWSYDKVDVDGDSRYDYLVITAGLDVTRSGVLGTDDIAYLFTNTSSGEQSITETMHEDIYQFYDVGNHEFKFIYAGRELNDTMTSNVDNFYVGGTSSYNLNYNFTLVSKTTNSNYDTFINDTLNANSTQADNDNRIFYDTLISNDFTPLQSAMAVSVVSHSFINSSSQLIKTIRLVISVRVFDTGQYKVELYESNSYTTTYNTSIWLEGGINDVVVYFPAVHFYQDQNDETFNIERITVQTDENDNDHDLYPSYSFSLPNEDVAPGEAELLNSGEATIDLLNHDQTLLQGEQHLIDEIVVNIPVMVYLEGKYFIEAELRSETDYNAVYGTNTTWLDDGLQYVQIHYDDFSVDNSLFSTVSSNAFRVDDVVLSTRGEQLDSNYTESNPMYSSELDKSELNFGIHFTHLGYTVDTSTLMVYTEFETDNSFWEGNKYITMVLADSNGDPVLYNSTTTIVPPYGERKTSATFFFDTQLLEKKGVDGPYQIRNWTIYDGNENGFVYPMLGEIGEDITTSQFDPYDPHPNLEVEVSLNPSNVEGGDLVDYTVRIENIGDEEALNVSLETMFEGPNVALLETINQTFWSQINPGEVEYASGVISILEFTSDFQAPVDFLFIFDFSGSMGEEISAVKNKAVDLLNLLSSTIPDFQVGMIVHGWSEYAEQPLEDFRNMVQLTTNMTVLVDYISDVSAGGGDEPIGDAAWLANNWAGWRDNSIKFVQLIGDEASDHGYVVGDPDGYNKYNGSELYEQAYTARNMGIKYISVLTSGYDGMTEDQFRIFANVTKGKLVYLSADASELPELTLDFVTNSMQDASVLVKARVTYLDPQDNEYSETDVGLLNYGSAFPTVGQPEVTQSSSTATIDIPVSDASGVDTVIIEHNVSVYDPQNPDSTDPSNLNYANTTATYSGSNNIWTATVDVSSFSDYILQFNVYANDTNGNMVKAGDDGSPFYASVSVSDTSDPTINTVSRTPSGTVYEDNSTDVYADVSDVGSNITTVLLYYSVDGNSWQTISMTLHNGTKDSGWWTGSLGQFQVGTKIRYYVVAFDYYGNRVKDDNDGVFYFYKVASEQGVDNQWPTISNAFINPTSPQADQDVKVTATVTDNIGVKNVSVAYSTNLSKFNYLEMTLQNGEYTANISSSYLQEGVLVYYYIVAYDTSNNRQQSSIGSFNPTGDGDDTPQEGEISITRPSDGSTITASNNVTVTVDTSAISESIAYVEAQLDSGSFFNLTVETSDVYGDILRNVANGQHSLFVRAVLDSGDTATDTVSFTVNYNPSVDAKPAVIKIHQPAEGAELSSSSVQVIAEINDDGNSITVEVRLDGGNWQQMTVDAASDYGFTTGAFGAEYTFSNVAEGSHTVEVKVTDSSGQTDALTNNFRVDLPSNNDGNDTSESGGGFLGYSMWMTLTVLGVSFIAITRIRKKSY